MRAFIAVDFEASDRLLGLLKALSSSEARLRVVRPENLHITLKFLGNVDEGMVPSIVDIMKRSAEGVPPFTVILRGSGAFPSLKSPRVLWIGVEDGDPLVTLAHRLAARLEDLGFPGEKRRFSLHLTVARVKASRGKGELAQLMGDYADETFGEQRVEDMRLKRSELRPSGPLYSDVARVPLE
ncbi:MAG: RNA 2',3'-cyclic phosphodiesterase [Thermoplasmata archaeon]